MRHYPSDSPEAVTRVVALALMADGAIDPGELEALKGSACCFRLGIGRYRFDQIVDEFCDDLEVCGNRMATGQYDLSTDCIGELLKDINDPNLREQAFGMMLDIISADGVFAHEETALIAQVVDCWELGSRAIREIRATHTTRPVAQTKPNWQAQYRRAEASN